MQTVPIATNGNYTCDNFIDNGNLYHH